MAKILILYGTREGQTRKIATRIANVVRARGHSAVLVDADHLPSPLDVEAFDAACIGGPIHSGGYPRAVVRFARKHRKWLQSVPSSFFSVGLAIASRTSDGRADSQRCVDGFIRKTGWSPRQVELIAGALLYTKYGFFIRWVMRRIAERAGGDTDVSRDYEYTDWARVDRFASDVAESAQARAATAAHSNAAA